jgi:Domain of unknown function (DUF4331)
MEMGQMSSHREAPEISKDPVADNTDVYAFVSPDSPKTVTLIANFVPLQDPPGGPNFFEFGDDVLYSIYIDNDGDGRPEISYVFRFKTTVADPKTFLYNTGQILSLDSPNWNRRQFYSVTRVDGGDTTSYGTGSRNRLRVTSLGQNLPCPPCNIGPRSTPDYAASLGQPAVQTLAGGMKVFAGQRREGFFVDLGAIFDLGDLRPFQHLHLIPSADAMGVDATKTLNVHTIAIRVPIKDLTVDGSVPTDPMGSNAVLGVWAAASRRKVRIAGAHNGRTSESGPWVQVSRLGNPLFNEVVVPMGDKDRWNAAYPVDDSGFAGFVKHPELAQLLPVLYPNVFPNLAAYTKPRADLEAILLTGIPQGIISGFQNFTGSVQADQLRLNVAIPPTTSNPSPFGLLGDDLAGFPNGRRVFDDVVSIELRAVAGATIPLVDSSYTPDAAAGELTEGLTPGADRYQNGFPYLGHPLDGFDTPPHS